MDGSWRLIFWPAPWSRRCGAAETVYTAEQTELSRQPVLMCSHPQFFLFQFFSHFVLVIPLFFKIYFLACVFLDFYFLIVSAFVFFPFSLV